jgi:hypothetical protein
MESSQTETEATQPLLCGEWAILGVCSGAQPCAHRHYFASETERSTVRQLRVRHRVRLAIAGDCLAAAEQRARPLGSIMREAWALRTDPAALWGRDCRSTAALFAQWLIAVYGRERLASGRGVVDVAGGNGELAQQLAMEYQIPATVVDPAAPPLTLSPTRTSCQGRAPAGATGAAVAWLVEHFDEGFGYRHPELLASASLLVGLHSDQPTGAIATVACGRVPPAPMAVVPCCVFPELFPKRRLGSGQPLRET